MTVLIESIRGADNTLLTLLSNLMTNSYINVWFLLMLLSIKKTHGSLDFCDIYTDKTYHIIYLFDVTRRQN